MFDQPVKRSCVEFSLVAESSKLNHHCVRGGDDVEIRAKYFLRDALLQNGDQLTALALIEVVETSGDCGISPGANSKFGKDNQLLWRTLQACANLDELSAQTM